MSSQNPTTPRKPRETPTPRIGALATLPLFFNLKGRRVLLAGGDAGAAWKAELLSSAGAQVDVFCDAPAQEMLTLAAERPDQVGIALRAWSIADFARAALAIGAIANDAEAKAFRCAAQAAGVPVNLVDKPAFCDFAFGAIVNRSPVVIGISTDGAAPVFGQSIRARIEAVIPQGFAAWAHAAKAWRLRLEPLHLPFRARRSFWEAFTRIAWAKPAAAPGDADFAVARAALDDDTARRGAISIVGAGPGDPELLTLKAVRALQSADVILYDDLVSDGVLDLARREATKIAVGKRGGVASCGQDDICATMTAMAMAGQRVVRLKGGDPAIFGRLDEELAAARAAGLNPEIVPGVTTASAAAAALGLSLTRRRLAPRLQFVTAHGADGGLPPGLDLAALADPAATTCIYMGRRTLPLLAAALTARGLCPDTPVRIVINATRANQTDVATTLGQAADAACGLDDDGPCLILIGRALGADQAASVPTRPRILANA